MSIERLFLFVIVSAFVFTTGCQSPEKPAQAVEKRVSSRKKLLDSYRALRSDSLLVDATEYPDSNNYRFRGHKLDSARILLLPQRLTGGYFPESEYFACYQFRLDSSRIGLITRTPSEYQPSSVKLIVFDEKADSCTEWVELAELWGDAGDVLIKGSWLWKEPGQGFRCLIEKQESSDHSVDDPKDSTVEHHFGYSLVRLSPVIDTVTGKDSATLAAMYQSHKK